MAENNQTLGDVRWWRLPRVSRVWLAFSIVTVYLVVSSPTAPHAWYTIALIFIGFCFGKMIHGKKVD